MPANNDSPFQLPLLARDHKRFLELSPQEADVWITRVFDAIRPQMGLIRAIAFDEDSGALSPGDNAPLNLEAVLLIAGRKVREVAAEMAGALFTPQRQQQLIPLLNAYCDELLAQGRGLDATFIEQGLMDMHSGKNPAQNILLVEICMRSIYDQVSLINGDPNRTNKAL